MTKILNIEIEPALLAIIEAHPTDWPIYFAVIVGDQRLSKETREKLAQIMDEVCQYSSVEELKQALSERDH
ncbi:MAG: hypothetical protein ABW098_18855 [Candidatus Thiodiazotropha sp.]